MEGERAKEVFSQLQGQQSKSASYLSPVCCIDEAKLSKFLPSNILQEYTKNEIFLSIYFDIEKYVCFHQQ